jgi:hypothetical protein
MTEANPSVYPSVEFFVAQNSRNTTAKVVVRPSLASEPQQDVPRAEPVPMRNLSPTPSPFPYGACSRAGPVPRAGPAPARSLPVRNLSPPRSLFPHGACPRAGPVPRAGPAPARSLPVRNLSPCRARFHTEPVPIRNPSPTPSLFPCGTHPPMPSLFPRGACPRAEPVPDTEPVPIRSLSLTPNLSHPALFPVRPQSLPKHAPRNQCRRSWRNLCNPVKSLFVSHTAKNLLTRALVCVIFEKVDPVIDWVFLEPPRLPQGTEYRP